MESTLKRERVTRPYPVLSSEMKQLRKSVDKRVFDVLLPAALPPEAKLVISTAVQGKENVVKKVESALTNATFVIAFDATGSMEKFAKQAAREMEAAFDGLPPQVVSGCKLGFVFFRDQDDDEKYAIVKPLPIPDAIKLLKDAATPAYMKGGGDPPEPVLDAVYIAHHLYPWGSDSNQTAGRRIIVAVLNDDAKPLTTGKIHDGVPPKIEPARIAADLLTDQIPVISVQVGPGVGSHLVEVLSTLGEGTKGTFIDWGSGDLDERGKKVSAALSAQITTKAEETRAEGEKIIGKIEFDYRGYPTIPLSVLDSPGSAAGEKLARLRNAGVKFNIDPGKGGVLIREGYILENPDLLEPQISIDKKTLDGLVTLFSALGVAGVDVNAMKESAGRALSAIAGENYDPKETIEVTIKKRLGIQFRSKLLSFNLEYLAGMTRDERLAMTKRIQDAGAKLSQFEDANLEALDKSPAVWMPVSQLP